MYKLFMASLGKISIYRVKNFLKNQIFGHLAPDKSVRGQFLAEN